MEQGELVAELYAYAVNIARSYANQAVEAEDFLQEILLVFLRIALAHSGRLDRTSLIKLAKVCARNHIKNLLHRRKYIAAHHAEIEEAEEVGDWTEERRRIVKDLVSMILRRLKYKDQVVLELLMDGQSVEDIVGYRWISRAELYKVIARARSVAMANNWIETGGEK